MNHTIKRASTLLIFNLLCFTLFSQTVIQMEQVDGVYRIPCTINGVKMKLIFDTGASMVSLSKTMAELLYDNDNITDKDFIGEGTSTVADGRTVKSTFINLRDIEIGGLHLKDIHATVSESQQAPLLLGQSAIQQLGPITINGNRLIINNSISTDIYTTFSDDKLEDVADKFYKDASYNNLIPVLLEIKNRHGLSLNGYCKLITSYAHIEEYELCLAECTNAYNKHLHGHSSTTSEEAKIIYLCAHVSCLSLVLRKEDIVWLERLLSIAKEEHNLSDMAYYNSAIGTCYSKLNSHTMAISHFRQAITDMLAFLNVSEYDVYSNKVANEELGLYYMNMALENPNGTIDSKHIMLSAKCGYYLAIKTCIEMNIDYR